MKHRHFTQAARRLTALTLALLLALPSAYAAAGSPQLRTTRELADGLTYSNTITSHSAAGRVESFSLELSPDSREVEPIFLQASGTAYGAGSINLAVSYAQSLGYHVLGAINTDFFAPSTGVPLGISIEDGIYKSSPEAEAAVVITDGEVELVEQSQVTLTLTNESTGGQTVLTHLNKYRADSGGLYLFNYDFSTVSTHTSTPGWMVRMELTDPDDTLSVSGRLELEVTELLRTDTSVVIGENEYILTAADAGGLESVFQSFQVGDRVTLRTDCTSSTLEDAQWASGVGDVMVRDGQITDSTAWTYVEKGRDPRSALGVREDGTLVLYAVDGRRSGYSGGLSQLDLAEEMLSQGCVWAVNLDGGGSTAISVWVPGQEGPSIVNIPSDGKPRACATYLLLVSRDEGDGDPDRLVLKNDGLVVLTGTSVDLGETAVLDSGLNILRDDPGEVEISSLDDLGRVEDNIYTAGSDAGTDTLELWSPDLDVEGTAQIHVVDHLTGLTVSRENSTDALTSLTLEPGDQVQLTAQGTYWSRAAMRDVGAISWTVEGSIGSITEDGLFTAEGPGGASGTLTASAGGQSQTIMVSLENSHEDVPEGHWAYTAVDYCYANGLVGGISDTEFGPDLHIRRGDFLLMLYGAAGKPAVTSPASFTDVSPSDYYYTAVSWAQANGLATGVGDGTLAPASDVTREQAFTILNQALPLLGITCQPGALTVLDQFGDRASLSDWAAQHAATLVAYQIVGGDTDGNLNPQAFLTRAEMAALLYKLSNYTPPTDLDPGALVQPEKDPQPGGTADPGQAEGPGQTADPDQPEDPGQTSQPEEPAVPVEGITLDTGELTLQAGSSYHFTPTLSPEGAAGTVVWTSSVPTVAPVTSDGTITNLNTTGGQVSVTITASCGDACTSAVVLCDTAASAGTVRGAENGLNVRSGPSTSHSVVGYLREGGRVILLAPPEDGWLHVSYLTQSGQAAIGYVSLDYIVLD